ncbi:MAG: hypothetical protein IRZ00_16805 [Gemmatimonadetes bacterium]|nr:hypothetical protein [Gemmatimonadota bacterium]
MPTPDDLDLEPPEIQHAGRRAAARERLARLHRRVDRPTRVLLRDFAIFEVKLLLDGLKGIAISQAAIVALVVDVVLGRRGHRPSWFYRVLRIGERIDLWLNLYGSSRGAADNPEGLFGESRAGSSTPLGQLERLADRFIVGDDGDGGWDAAPPDEPPREAPPGEPQGEARGEAQAEPRGEAPPDEPSREAAPPAAGSAAEPVV